MVHSGPTHVAALRLVQSSRTAQKLANWLLVALVVTICGLTFLPWQQSARGTGQVVAFVPQERQQVITSPTKGVVARVGEGLVEGARVQRGDFILEIQPTAANMQEQLQGQLKDLHSKLETALSKAQIYATNAEDFRAARDFAVQAAEELVQAAEAKVEAKRLAISGYEAKELQARLNFERQESLFRRGLKPEKEIEKLRKDWEVAQADLKAAQRELEVAQKERQAKIHEVSQKQREGQTKVEYARGMQADADGQAATTRKEIKELEIKLGELERLVITAPRDGTIFRMPIFERGQAVKEGDSLFTIVPDASERAVELWVSGNDMPLVQPGAHARLQFEGWPAVQFAGWPSVAVGTFGGEVISIDETTNDNNHRFRVLIKPEAETDWPSQRFLRQGVRVNGWVMLGRVQLGYEIWRQLNGFPPSVSKSEPAKDSGKESDKGKSKVKLPK